LKNNFMLVEVKIFSPGESITEVELAKWLVSDGELVNADQDIAEVDSDKATMTVTSTAAGKINILHSEGERLGIGVVIATIDSSVEVPAVTKEKKQTPIIQDDKKQTSSTIKINSSPLAKKIIEHENIDINELTKYSSKKIMRKDVDEFLRNHKQDERRPIRVVPMSSLRRRLADRLVAVKNQTAMLTTFNEVDMTNVMSYRKALKTKQANTIIPGLVSFFVKAATNAMNEFPQINAMIDGDNIIYHDYVDMAIAVSTPKGLMTPVVRNCELLSMEEIETAVAGLATKARSNKITIEELSGGTFTISNGGIFGSMMSTPILNPPQSAILGIHNIIERPIAINGKVEIRPMMYLALSYDHRIIDGKESVGFIIKIKEFIENFSKEL